MVKSATPYFTLCQDSPGVLEPTPPPRGVEFRFSGVNGSFTPGTNNNNNNNNNNDNNNNNNGNNNNGVWNNWNPWAGTPWDKNKGKGKGNGNDPWKGQSKGNLGTFPLRASLLDRGQSEAGSEWYGDLSNWVQED